MKTKEKFFYERTIAFLKVSDKLHKDIEQLERMIYENQRR